MIENLIDNYSLLLYLRLINIILITLATAAWVIFYKRYKLIMAVAPITWLVHVLIYGIFRFSYTLGINTAVAYEKSEVNMNIWTAIIIMHGIILLLVSAIGSVPLTIPIKKKEDK